ncbi:hypothetical protein BT63DRAFT_458061 [Microthyrium microscopicum]|uniref:SAC domain-containing protein n=1 Tax=Microthyrium microscopicum TaxID=703497 RepID=A0A6A6U6M8_9PEZI|nr:hypothetical protein BT63DRAFT_458061 [Microthyrium microscopicum]
MPPSIRSQVGDESKDDVSRVPEVHVLPAKLEKIDQDTRSTVQEDALSRTDSNARLGQNLNMDGNSESQFTGEDEEISPHQFLNGKSHGHQLEALPGQLSENAKTMQRFVLYETASRFYLVGQDMLEQNFRVLKIDRTSPPGLLNIFEDENVYDRQSINELLATIEDGNKASGGLRTKSNSCGLLGFVRFTEAYYMILITKRTQVAMVGGHFIFQIEATEVVPLTTGSTSRFQRDRNPEEARYLGILQNLDLTKFFYFSYSYNITRTLQENIQREREAFNQGVPHNTRDWHDMFVWNHHLLEPANGALKRPYDWCVPTIHGYVEQSSLDIFGRRIYLTIIARRSRYFAGARYLKRGANDQGYVANDVETEQIVSDVVTTSFHGPGPVLFSSPNYTSYVQHRGSIPLHWSQDNSGVTPKPDIDINLVDPFYAAAALHFDDLFKRYGAPVYVLNLIKARERNPRESKLGIEFERALAFLNQSLPEDKRILYKAFDMSRAAKTRGQDVVGVLELIAQDIMEETGMFQNGDCVNSIPKMQNGIARTNCIDCLDRTNAAQFVIGKRALGHQLQALGVIDGPHLEYDSDVVNTFTHMYHAHGDTIAIQYGGSHLAHTLSTYRKLNEWKNHSRDMVESFKRYYHNSFLDSQRQEAYNLFLGNYIYAQGQPMLWDLPSDYYLHHADPREWITRTARHYVNWYTPENLRERKLPVPMLPAPMPVRVPVEAVDNYWLEYYRPLAISSLVKLFSWKLSSRPRYLPETTAAELARNPSPFIPRRHANLEPPDSPGKKPRKGQHVTILDPQSDDMRSIRSFNPNENANAFSGLLDTNSVSSKNARSSLPADKNQWTLKQFWDNSLSPTVTQEDEYIAYVNHPLTLPLVTSTEPSDMEIGAHSDFAAYISRAESAAAGVAGNEADWVLNAVHTRATLADDAELDVFEENLADFAEFLAIAENENPLTVSDEDGGRKRYKAYRQWLKGKSFFKQSKLDPEYKST